MATNLTTHTSGGTDQGCTWLLHTSGTALATGARIGDGSGADSCLWLSTSGIGVVNPSGGFMHTIVSSATAARTLTLGDASVAIIGYGGTLYPETVMMMAADVSPASPYTTPVLCTGLLFGCLSNVTYEFEGVILVQSSNTGALPKISLTGPVETSMVVYETRAMSAASGSGTNEFVMDSNAWSVSGTPIVTNNTAIAAANTTYMVRIRGIFRTTGTPVIYLAVNIQSSSASYNVTAKADSMLRVRRVR